MNDQVMSDSVMQDRAVLSCRNLGKSYDEGPQSVVFDEAENRIHAQKSVLLWAFGMLSD